ncbi:MAG: hypothetical protein WC027_02795 [Candidatus Paceibacterota bacterium]
MNQDVSKLSPEAQELIRLTEEVGRKPFETGSDIDLPDLLAKKPGLVKGLNEYVHWREERGKMIAESKKTAPAGHALRDVAAKIRRKGGEQQ